MSSCSPAALREPNTSHTQRIHFASKLPPRKWHRLFQFTAHFQCSYHGFHPELFCFLLILPPKCFTPPKTVTKRISVLFFFNTCTLIRRHCVLPAALHGGAKSKFFLRLYLAEPGLWCSFAHVTVLSKFLPQKHLLRLPPPRVRMNSPAEASPFPLQKNLQERNTRERKKESFGSPLLGMGQIQRNAIFTGKNRK